LDEHARLPRPDQDRSLEEVIEDFRRCLRPDGPYGPFDEWSVYDESFRRIVRWAREAGCWFEGLQPLREGGREHDVLHDPRNGSWLKFTKPSRAGYVVSANERTLSLEPGLPLEYLERLSLQNRIFGDSVRFCGMAGESNQPRIVTRQADIIGEAATPEEIRLLMKELGFTELSPRYSLGYADSLCFARQDVAVFDLRPANVVRTSDGVVVPIDSIPVVLNKEMLRLLKKVAFRKFGGAPWRSPKPEPARCYDLMIKNQSVHHPHFFCRNCSSLDSGFSTGAAGAAAACATG
jgi:hypothetical protein